MMKNTLLILTLLVCGCSKQYICDIDAAFSDVTPMVEKANISFKSAEEKILKVVPEVIDETNPDPAKCVCKGTGIIRHGDGHTTKCPYHGNSTATMKR